MILEKYVLRMCTALLLSLSTMSSVPVKVSYSFDIILSNTNG